MDDDEEEEEAYSPSEEEEKEDEDEEYDDEVAQEDDDDDYVEGNASIKKIEFKQKNLIPLSFLFFPLSIVAPRRARAATRSAKPKKKKASQFGDDPADARRLSGRSRKTPNRYP